MAMPLSIIYNEKILTQKNLSLTKSKWRMYLPHLLVIFWLSYLGITIWQHVLHSVQPPLYDPLS